MSVRLDASTDQLTRASPPSPASGITMVATVYNSVDQDEFATIGRIHASGSTILTWASSGDGTGGPNYFTGGGTVTNSEGLPVGEWRNVAVTCTGTSAQSLVRNPGFSTEVDSGTVSSSGTPTQLAIGGRGGGDTSEWWNGRIVYFRVWTAVLSQSEIEAEWDSATPVRTSGLWADWPLTVHTDLTDHSGNGRDLTAGSTAVTTEADPTLPDAGTTGELAASIPLQTVSLPGEVIVGGAVAVSIPLQTLALPGDVVVGGQVAVSIPLQTLALPGDVVTGGALAASIPLQQLALAGEVVTGGALAASIPLQAVHLFGAETVALVRPLRAGTATKTAGRRAGAATKTAGRRAGAVS
jgi:hypothetical protein